MKDTKEKKLKISVTKPEAFVISLHGETPLLLHNIQEFLAVEQKRKGVIDGPEEEARKGAYFNTKGIVCVPTRNLYRCLVNTAKSFKGSRSRVGSAKKDLAAALFLRGELVPIITATGSEATQEDYIVDVRPVRLNGKSAINRARPRFDEWGLRVTAEIDPELISPELFAEILVIAGRREGLGDFRPGSPISPGPYGKFTLTEFASAE